MLSAIPTKLIGDVQHHFSQNLTFPNLFIGLPGPISFSRLEQQKKRAPQAREFLFSGAATRRGGDPGASFRDCDASISPGGERWKLCWWLRIYLGSWWQRGMALYCLDNTRDDGDLESCVGDSSLYRAW